MKGRVKGERGQALVEYALVVSFVVLVEVVALHVSGISISSLLNKIAGEL